MLLRPTSGNKLSECRHILAQQLWQKPKIGAAINSFLAILNTRKIHRQRLKRFSIANEMLANRLELACIGF